MGLFGYFILGFMLVFFGGIFYMLKWELFDLYDDQSDDWY